MPDTLKEIYDSAEEDVSSEIHVLIRTDRNGVLWYCIVEAFGNEGRCHNRIVGCATNFPKESQLTSLECSEEEAVHFPGPFYVPSDLL